MSHSLCVSSVALSVFGVLVGSLMASSCLVGC